MSSAGGFVKYGAIYTGPANGVVEAPTDIANNKIGYVLCNDTPLSVEEAGKLIPLKQ